MAELWVDLKERGYPILVEAGLRKKKEIYPEGDGRKILIISDEQVAPLYGQEVKETLEEKGWIPSSYLIPPGEESKNLEEVEKIYHLLITHDFDRTAAILALGGGVVGDLAGFVSSTYLRGISFYQVPTTLLAMVDSSVGGKVGVNHPLGKNLIGSFYQPRKVIMDIETLKTLPQREFRSGLAEAIKYGMIWDTDFFSFYEEHIAELLQLQEEPLIHVIHKSCAIKAQVVSRDEREEGIRAILNYGHTLGHALEAATHYRRFLHGEAVSLGISFVLEMALGLEMIDSRLVKRQRSLLKRAGLPIHICDISYQDILKHIYHDKKRVKGVLRFVVPVQMGKVEQVNISDEVLLKALIRFLGDEKE